MELVLSILGIALSLAVAYWEHRKAKRAEARLESLAETLPDKLLSGVRDALTQHALPAVAEADGWSTPGAKSDQSPWLRTRYADLDGDGRDELLVEVTSGPHSTTLLVYQVKNWEFDKLAELHSSTINGFDIVDSPDSVGKRVETVEVAKRPELPYVYGLRDRVAYRLVGGTFEEVGRAEGWDDDDLERIKLEIAAQQAET